MNKYENGTNAPKSLGEALALQGYLVNTEKSEFGNLLKGNLALDNHFIDFDKKMEDVTDDDYYQIGRTILFERAGKEKPLFRDEIIKACKELLNQPEKTQTMVIIILL